MATIAQTVAVLARELNLPEPYIAQRARRLREVGILPASNGRDYPALHIGHLASLVLALAADVAVKDAPNAVTTYSGLLLHGIDPELMPATIRPAASTLRPYLEHILGTLAAGDTNHRLTIEVVGTWPEVRIFDPDDRKTLVFVPVGTLPTHWQGDAVRRSTTITGRALSRVARATL